MRFRTRLVVAATTAVAIAVLAASAVAFLASRSALVSSVDNSLYANAFKALNSDVINSDSAIGNVLQVVSRDGEVVVPGNPVSLPVTPAVLHVAATQRGGYYTNITLRGEPWRMLVEPVPPYTYVAGSVAGSQGVAFPLLNNGAMQIAYPLTGVDNQLRRLGVVLSLVALFGVALAVLLGWLVGRTALVPLYDLTGAMEEVAETTDVSRRLEPGELDELGRLRRAFNRLLAALERSQDAQRQLVLDASHELRTPLTSLRTNLEVVRRLDELPEADREVLVSDVLTQLEELTHLVGDLAELSRGDHAEQARAVLRLDRLVEDAASIAETHGRTRGVEVHAVTRPTWVNGQSARLSRAVGNLIDNALKWSPAGQTVEVTCADGVVTVRDHGPGIAESDLPYIFDRFYRSPGARALPGSGLGLAIVAQVAESESGSVTAANAPDGGAVFRLTLPTVAPPAEDLDAAVRPDLER
jgi:two-component system sensor histidine kinase MprB